MAMLDFARARKFEILYLNSGGKPELTNFAFSCQFQL